MSYKFTKEELEYLLNDYNKIALKEQKLDAPSQVCIWDETLRDGEQNPTVYLILDEKIHLAKLMGEIGVKLIAIGFPAVSKSEKKIVKTIVNEVKRKHEETSKKELRKSFNMIKQELDKISKGVSDKEFFEIVNKYAQPYVPDEFKPKN